MVILILSTVVHHSRRGLSSRGFTKRQRARGSRSRKKGAEDFAFRRPASGMIYIYKHARGRREFVLGREKWRLKAIRGPSRVISLF